MEEKELYARFRERGYSHRQLRRAKFEGNTPMVARRARNLGDILIHSEFVKSPTDNWLSTYPRSKGMFPCGKCQLCPLVDHTDTFVDPENRK